MVGIEIITATLKIQILSMWMPVISDLTHKIGGLHIIEKSHLLNLETIILMRNRED